MTLSGCICTVGRCSSRVLFFFYVSFINKLIYVVICLSHLGVQHKTPFRDLKVSALLIPFATVTVFHHEYGSLHAPILYAQVPYQSFVLLLYVQSVVTGGSCSLLHGVHSHRWHGRAAGGVSRDDVRHTSMLPH